MKLSGIVMILMTPILVSAQDSLNTRPYDFWVGHWAASWSEGDGQIGKGSNQITYTLDSTVIQEDFRITEGQSKGFKGRSISVYNPARNMWKQAWADNQGGYFDFNGGRDEEGNPIFITPIRESGDNEIVSRMVFKNITQDSFTWDWEGSLDGGQNWQLNWRIHYTRMGSGGQAHPSAPPQIRDFDPMIGTCQCKSQRIGANGNWQDPVNLDWTFKYIMNGTGIQDEFTMSDGQTGGSIRQYNVDSSAWYVHYYSSNVASPKLQSWKGAKNANNEIILYSPSPGQGGVQGFLKLTFYDMVESGYKWKGEWVNEDESIVSPFWKIACNRSN